MNKYEQSFENYSELLKIVCSDKYEENYDLHYWVRVGDENSFKELVDKATPKKTKNIKTEFGKVHNKLVSTTQGNCPKCNKKVWEHNNLNFCQGTKEKPCGQTLDWDNLEK